MKNSCVRFRLGFDASSGHMRRDDQELVRRMRAGEDEAYEEVIRKHGPMLLGVAKRLLGDPDDAADCFQIAMLKAVENLDSFERRSKLSTWLYRIVVNTCLMRLRESKRRCTKPIDDLLSVFDDHDCRIESVVQPASPETLLEREQTRGMVRAAVGQLPDSYRTVLVLRDFEERGSAEVAELLGLEEGNVRVRLHRARSALKKLLEPLWDSVPEAAATQVGSR